MTELQQLRVSFREALSTIERAIQEEDPEEARVLAIVAANYILDTRRPVLMQRSTCLSPTCRRVITEADPIFAGYCSTVCREANHARISRSVFAKFDDGRSTNATFGDGGYR